MADLDLETVERVARWCAEAGRQCAPAEIRAALGSLAWDELLTVRALLADPPPARPLGPFALADLARGLPADAAAEREREQRYPRPEALPPASVAVAATKEARPVPAVAAERRAAGRKGRPKPVLVRKAAALRPAPAPPPPPRPLLDELLLPAGRNDLERLFRKHGGRRPHLLAALATTHRRADGAPIDDGDLDRLLEHHGLARGFQRRERDELRHALRAAGGVLSRAAVALGFQADGLALALARLELGSEAEALREERRRELRGRATLSERAQLITSDPERLSDLGLLGEFERDLAARLPEHLRALERQREPVALGLARTLSMPVKEVHDLMTRLGVELPTGGHGSLPGARPLTGGADRPVAPAAAPGASPARASGPRSGPPSAPRGVRRDAFGAATREGGRSGPPRPAGPRPAATRTEASRPFPERSSSPRPSSPRPSSSRPSSPRPSSSRPSSARPSTARPSSPRSPSPRPAARPWSPRSGPARGAPRSGPRPAGAPRSGGGRPPSPRPGGRRGPGR